MTRLEHLKFCKICKNQKFDFKNGIICSLTNQIADFEISCNNFDENQDIKSDVENKSSIQENYNKTASQGKRFANYLIDIVCFFVFCILLGVVLGIIVGIFFPSLMWIFTDHNFIINYLIGFVVGVIFFTMLEASNGRTFGKLITKTKVVTEHGEKPDFKTILLRSACRFIPFDPLSFLGSDNSGWHDKISKTRVVEL